MNKRLQKSKYLAGDYVTAIGSWSLFFIFRKLYVEPQRFGYKIPLEMDIKFLLGLVIVPICWLFIYYITGYYKNIYRKSWMDDIVYTFLQTSCGVLFIFFTLILDDYVSSYRNYYLLVLVLFSIHFLLTLIPRLMLTLIGRAMILDRKIGFNTLIIGSGTEAAQIHEELSVRRKSLGNFFIGFIQIRNQQISALPHEMKNLGSLQNLVKIVRENKIEEVIAAPEHEDYDLINEIMNKLAFSNVFIKIKPEVYRRFAGKVKMEHVFGSTYIQLPPYLMPPWQENIKQLIDIIVSIMALTILSPLILVLTVGIKISSRGPVIYTHERIGRFGKPFKFYKFRSMKEDAEASGPELSSKNDKRLTNLGRFLRKYRLDEIPNFYNVLKGDLSIVGPRPEREYYIRQILQKAPYYIHIQRVKPGITSWGQVRYGYAENIEQMLNRLNYDIMYIWNMSLLTDFKILFYTLQTIMRGRGV
jgi:exopolysaccharide biosynthesis polyprenyl glycosylphosphotransferase